MLPIVGDTYDIREELKRMGCRWNSEIALWCAPDEGLRAAAQTLADGEPWRKWRAFCDGLLWQEGSFTPTAWEAGLNACSRGIPRETAMEEIRARITSAGKAPEAGWIERNVGRAYEKAEPPAIRGVVPLDSKARKVKAEPAEEEWTAPKPEYSPEKLASFAGKYRDVVDAVWLADRSPIDPQGVKADGFLRALYRASERVVVLDVFASQGQWVWSAEEGFVPTVVDFRAWEGEDKEHKRAPAVRKGSDFAATGLQGIWYLCNPVDGSFRQTAEQDKWLRPKWSRRWEGCVTDWRYFVFESDAAPAREWMGAIVQLPLKIAAIYTSGGASIHVLVRVDAQSKGQFDLWRETAKRSMIPLGADPGCMSAVRLTRLPACVRERDKDGNEWPTGPRMQRLLYLDPEPVERRLVDVSVVRDTFGPWRKWAEGMLSRPVEECDVEEWGNLVGGLKQVRTPRAKVLVEELQAWRAAVTPEPGMSAGDHRQS